jgi:hypothetical protein
MRHLAAVILVFCFTAGVSQPIYRKGPTFNTFRSDSLFTSDYFLTSPTPGAFTFSVLPVVSGGLEMTSSENNVIYHTQLAVAGGYRSNKVRIEGYVNGGTGTYPGFLVDNPNHRLFPGFSTVKRAPGDSSANRLQYFSPGFIIEYKPDSHFTFTAGYDKNFIGQGYRSVLLSDNASNYPFLKLNAKIWKLSYTALFAYFDNDLYDRQQYYPSNKYAAMHLLEFKPWDWLDIQLYESVLWQARDSTYNRGFDVNYLNPLIFYRPVEFSAGSSDNALVGGAINIRPARNLTLYSQFMLDEFLLREVKAGNGWWANKFAVQGGIKAFDIAGVKGLSALAEGNLARPYTYSHATPLTNYAHNSQALAHPLGSNFYEALFMLQYKGNRHRISLLAASNTKGYNGLKNEGGDIFRDYKVRSKDYGNTIAQGNKVKVNVMQLSYGYRMGLGIPLELTAYAGLYQRAGAQTVLLGLGLRTPVFNIYSDY